MYSVYTKEFDEVLNASSYMAEWIAENPGVKNMIENIMASNCPKTLPTLPSDTSPVTFLLDCSGSMRGGIMMRVAVSLVIFGDMLHATGRPFEILGFTTKQWKGGDSRKKWLDAGRPQQPGRLNDLRHIIFKSMEDDWQDARLNIMLTLKEGLLKENIDGEALEWAISRTPAKGKLIFMSDGAPIDDSTLSVNHAKLLDDHLRSVLSYAGKNKVDLRTVTLRDGDHKISWNVDYCFSVPTSTEVTEVLETLSDALKE